MGGVAQLAIQVPSLWRIGFRPRLLPDFALRDPGTRRIATLMAPATLGVAAVQVNVVVNSSFASLVSDGAISWLSYAFRLMQLPIGVFGVAVGTTALTHLSRDAANQDWDSLRATLRRGLRMVLFLTVPSTVGLALLGVPIIRLIYEHGRFSPHATLETARALSGYAVGLVAYAAIKVVAPAFYALGRTRVPLAGSVTAVAANLLWNLAHLPPLRPRRPRARDVDRRAGELHGARVRVRAAGPRPPHARPPGPRSPHPRRERGHGRRGLGGDLDAIELLPGDGTAMYAVKAFVPIVVGVVVYFGAARALPSRRGAHAASSLPRVAARGACQRSCGMRSRGPRKYCIGE